jgi:predicted RNA polymerase sigma factor
LRFSKLGDTEDEVVEEASGLARQVNVAARLADSKGDTVGGLATLERGIARYPDAAPIDRGRALTYRADLLIRLDRRADARDALASVAALDLDDADREALQPEVDHLASVLAESA